MNEKPLQVLFRSEFMNEKALEVVFRSKVGLVREHRKKKSLSQCGRDTDQTDSSRFRPLRTKPTFFYGPNRLLSKVGLVRGSKSRFGP